MQIYKLFFSDQLCHEPAVSLSLVPFCELTSQKELTLLRTEMVNNAMKRLKELQRFNWHAFILTLNVTVCERSAQSFTLKSDRPFFSSAATSSASAGPAISILPTKDLRCCCCFVFLSCFHCVSAPVTKNGLKSKPSLVCELSKNGGAEVFTFCSSVKYGYLCSKVPIQILHSVKWRKYRFLNSPKKKSENIFPIC